VILAAGDVTRHEEVKWGYTFKQCEPYLKYQERRILFREAVLAFFGIKGTEHVEKSRKGRKCRTPAACSMCTKRCSERLVGMN